MPRLLRPIGPKTGVEQARLFHVRERLRSLRLPFAELFRTHRFVETDSNIDTDDYFGDDASRSQPITIALSLRRSTSGSNGLLFEFGSSTRGMAAWVDGDDVGFAAGAGAGNDGASVVAADVLKGVDQLYQLSFSTIPGKGKVGIWVAGQIVGRATSTSGSFAGPWADTENGAIAGGQGTTTARCPAGQAVTLANADIVGPVNFYLHQRPRQFG